MFSQIAGKVALITGSTSGIGLGIAQVLAKHGAHVCLNGFGDLSQINKLQEEIQQNHKVNTSYANTDLRTKEGCYELVDLCEKQLGPVDILINNAGIQHTDVIENFPDNKYVDIINLNMNSNFYTMKKVIPRMKEQNWGRIVNIASAHGLAGSVEKSAYCAAKHGVIGMTKVVGLETAQFNIAANCVCPGWVYTDLVKQQIKRLAELKNIPYEEAKKQLIGGKHPSGVPCEVEDISNLTLFLCSDSASQIKGAAYNIDGGWLAQ